MSFNFDGYTVRPVTPKDREYIDLLIQADPWHRDKMTADFFLSLKPGEDAWALEDAQGEIVFYFKTTVAARIDIQFAPIPRRETMLGLMRGLAWLEARLVSNRFRELFFDPQGPELAEFAKRRMGFVEAQPTLVRNLSLSRFSELEIRPVERLSTNRPERDGTG